MQLTLLRCIAITLLLLAIAVAALSRPEAAPSRVGTHIGNRAPDFALLDRTGRTWRLRQLGSSPALLVFACGCADCRRLLTAFARIPNVPGYHLIVSSLPPMAIERLAAEANGYFVGLFDPFARAAQIYSSQRCPRVWLFDRRQIIRYASEPGQAQPDEILAAVQSAVAASIAPPGPRYGRLSAH